MNTYEVILMRHDDPEHQVACTVEAPYIDKAIVVAKEELTEALSESYADWNLYQARKVGQVS